MRATLLKYEDRTPVEAKEPPAERLHLAVIAAADRVLLTMVARDPESLNAQLAHYIEQNAAEKLWPADAARALALLAGHKPGEAVDLYFARVGDRWDLEILHREVVDLE